MQFYQTDERGVLLYADQAALLPFGAIVVAPPELATGSVARWESTLTTRTDATYGHVGTGAWVIDDDYRTVPLYKTSDGVLYEIGSDVGGEAYYGTGPVPAWLTPQHLPDSFHVWVDGAWVLDAQAQAATQQENERTWRDAEINRISWLRERHRDELDAGLDQTLTQEQFAALLAYIQSLRDWTDAPMFPDATQRPVPPSWLPQA